ncbi:MAG: response regulator [Gemmatimonadota bacterium]|nr:response regulator [Gemmatimonadota bacterium]
MTASSRARHVLVVEDNVDVGDAFRILFESTGRRVSVVRTVADALAVARADPVDLMLLDLTLPDGSGLEILEDLGGSASRPRVTVALTGRDEPDVVRRCYALGCAAVLVKPVPARELLRRAEAWLSSGADAS